jgi:hypothetical protein
MILKSGSNWLFPLVFSVQITLSGSHSGNSFEFSHRLTGFLNYALFCLSFCLSLNLKPVNYFRTRRSSMAKREFGSVRPDTCSPWVRSSFKEDLPMIDAQLRFNQCNSFREEYISVFSPYGRSYTFGRPVLILWPVVAAILDFRSAYKTETL